MFAEYKAGFRLQLVCCCVYYARTLVFLKSGTRFMFYTYRGRRLPRFVDRGTRGRKGENALCGVRCLLDESSHTHRHHTSFPGTGAETTEHYLPYTAALYLGCLFRKKSQLQ